MEKILVNIIPVFAKRDTYVKMTNVQCHMKTSLSILLAVVKGVIEIISKSIFQYERIISQSFNGFNQPDIFESLRLRVVSGQNERVMTPVNMGS